MKLGSKKSIMHIMIIIILLLSGMCSYKTETDSFFACTPIHNTGAYDDAASMLPMAAPEEDWTITELAFTAPVSCTTEMLGQHDAVSLLTASAHTGSGTETRILSELIQTTSVVIHRSLSFLTSCQEAFPCVPYNMDTIVYIHHKDGQKA